MRRVVPIVRDNLSQADVTPVIYSLDQVAFKHPYHTLHFVTNFAFTLNEVTFEQRLRVPT